MVKDDPEDDDTTNCLSFFLTICNILIVSQYLSKSNLILEMDTEREWSDKTKF